VKVPWISKGEIADRASQVLAGYEGLTDGPVRPPVPVEDIIERSLGLTLTFGDLEDILGAEDVLGATYVERKLVCINENLLGGRLEGRLIFTCAHEAGHWVLHRHLVEKSARTGAGSEIIVCRTGLSREPIEWQADYFAACLLMPEKEVKEAFHRTVGRDHLVLENVESSFGGTSLLIDPCVENWHRIASEVMEAGDFSNVSKQAMALRLLDLGLLLNRTKAAMGWGRYRAKV
jgi:Zn-dependent peptidase ImmA (M78 family)